MIVCLQRGGRAQCCVGAARLLLCRNDCWVCSGVWYLTHCTYTSVLLVKVFLKAGRGIRIALLMYHRVLVCDMVMSRAVRVIRDVYSVLFTWPCLMPLGIH